MPVSKRVSTQELLGAVVVIVGIILLLDTTGVAETGPLLIYVPSLFVLFGLYALVQSGFRNLFGPLLLIVLAGAWQIAALDLVPEADLVSFWPALIILFGVSLLLGRLRTKAVEVGDQSVDGIAVFGGRNERVTSSRFTGADLTAIFGGYELDLRDAEVADRPARISAVAMFGGVDVIVPRRWNVRLDVLPIFGDVEDERPRRKEEHEEIDLIVTGFVAFGGISVND
ncbi:MAG: LiaF-related protein [Halorubrum sp.]|uniref:LiaF transmembrane domain-containing protein n=1 Tax=Halorubrum sp. TaxID=1879286 RepID=UPI0039708D5E